MVVESVGGQGGVAWRRRGWKRLGWGPAAKAVGTATGAGLAWLDRRGRRLGKAPVGVCLAVARVPLAVHKLLGKASAWPRLPIWRSMPSTVLRLRNTPLASEPAQCCSRWPGSVPYTHMTLPTILRV